MFLHVRKFCERQRPALKKILDTRLARVQKGQAEPESILRPVSLQTINVAVHLDASVTAFGKSIRHDAPDALLLRVLQFVAAANALSGTCCVEKDDFGPCVLTRPFHHVTSREGARIWDALVACGICVEVDAEQVDDFARKYLEKASLVGHKSDTGGDREGHASGTRGERVDRRAGVPYPYPDPHPDPNPHPHPRPTPLGADAPPAANGTTGGDRSASPLSDTERRAILAGCASLHRLAAAPADVRRTARQLANAISDGKADPAQAREFLVSILSFDASRMAYGMAKKA